MKEITHYDVEAVKTMLSQGHTHFSALKISTVRPSETAGSWLYQLERYVPRELRKQGLSVYTSSYLIGGDGRSSPLVLLLGANEGLGNATNRISAMVDQCPDGELYDYMREAYDTHWGGIKNFRPFMAKSREESFKNNGLLKVAFGPADLTPPEMKVIAELFMRPIAQPEPRFSIDDD